MSNLNALFVKLQTVEKNCALLIDVSFKGENFLFIFYSDWEKSRIFEGVKSHNSKVRTKGHCELLPHMFYEI